MRRFWPGETSKNFWTVRYRCRSVAVADHYQAPESCCLGQLITLSILSLHIHILVFLKGFILRRMGKNKGFAYYKFP